MSERVKRRDYAKGRMALLYKPTGISGEISREIMHTVPMAAWSARLERTLGLNRRIAFILY